MALRRRIQRAARTPAGDIADQAWWALGDAPVRVAETLTPLVDGRARHARYVRRLPRRQRDHLAGRLGSACATPDGAWARSARRGGGLA